MRRISFLELVKCPSMLRFTADATTALHDVTGLTLSVWEELQQLLGRTISLSRGFSVLLPNSSTNHGFKFFRTFEYPGFESEDRFVVEWTLDCEILSTDGAKVWAP